jgi:hypothetical protein
VRNLGFRHPDPLDSCFMDLVWHPYYYMFIIILSHFLGFSQLIPGLQFPHALLVIFDSSPLIFILHFRFKPWDIYVVVSIRLKFTFV